MAPTFVTHYYMPGQLPFQNLSDLPEDELAIVLNDLNQNKEKTGLQRIFGPRYMDIRRRTEEKLLRLFIEAGGKPERKVPHYFVLGSSKWFRGLAINMQEVRVPVRQLPASVSSFTYPDSFTAMGLAQEYGLPYEKKPYHEQVFRLSQLSDIVEHYGLPADDPDDPYEGYHRRTF